MDIAERNDYGTPTILFNKLHSIFNFTHDVCASTYNAKLESYWSINDNALQQDWNTRGNVLWMNPPYNKIKGKSQLSVWMEKAHDECMKYPELTIVCLTPSSTSESWFQKFIFRSDISAFTFINKRIKFELPDTTLTSARHSSTLTVLAQKVESHHLLKEFDPYAMVRVQSVYKGRLYY
jgi:phage N-6-adenine-methyltransferase